MHILIYRYNMITLHTSWALTDLMGRYTSSALGYTEVMVNNNGMEWLLDLQEKGSLRAWKLPYLYPM